jgi:NAD(P)-dependent dehydrogenase (short-subunit alcohol dehydrogenase family)
VDRGKQADGAAAGFPYHPADPWDEDQVHDLMHHAVDLFGRLDGVFCNAGSEAAVNEWPLEDVVERMVDDELTQNYKTTLWAIKTATPHMSDGGSIVAMTADTAFTGAATIGAWTAAKAATTAVARSAALELAVRRIRVNCISTGPLETAYLDQTEFEDGIAARLTPLGRLGRPEELAALVHYLLADESAYVTGAVIPFDGGASAGVVAPNVLDAMAQTIGVIGR